VIENPTKKQKAVDLEL